MAEIEGYSHKEIAAKLGIESHSSSSQLTRTKEMLRKIINKRMMTFIAIILVSIPMFRLLWKKDNTECESVNTAQVENENGVQIKNWKRQKEEPQTHKKSEMDVVTEKKNEINQNIAQTRNDSIATIDTTLNIQKTFENSNIVIIEDDSTTIDTIRNIWHENNKPYIAKDVDHAKKHEWQLLAAGSLGLRWFRMHTKCLQVMLAEILTVLNLLFQKHFLLGKNIISIYKKTCMAICQRKKKRS